MEISLTTVTFRYHPLSPAHHSNFRSRTVTFHKTTSFSFSSSSLKPIKSSLNISNNHQNPKSSSYCHITKTVKPSPPPVIKTTVITGVTIASVFFSRFTLKPLIAAPVAAVESIRESKSEEIKALKTRLFRELKKGDVNVNEVIELLNQLSKLEPKNSEWKLRKSQIHWYYGENEFAILGFEEIITNDPLHVEAYRNLVRVARSESSVEELKKLEKRVMERIDLCKKEKKKDDVIIRDFKILLAEIFVVERKNSDALKIYEELIKEEPGDFRAYFGQGIVYTLLGKNDDAEKNFEMFWKLVPKGHHRAEYFDSDVATAKSLAMEDERTNSKSGL